MSPASATWAARARAAITFALVLLVRAYQVLVSPLLVALFGARCRFYPSCSEYALACLRSAGPLRGSLLALRRLGRCHPLHPGGVDLPPDAA